MLYVAEDRKQSSLDGFWETLTPEQISGIGAVAMDMWDPYIASVRAHVPEADSKIVFDKFHVAQHLGAAICLQAAIFFRAALVLPLEVNGVA